MSTIETQREEAAGKRQEADAGRGIEASGNRGIWTPGSSAKHRPVREPVGTTQHDTVSGVGHSQGEKTLQVRSVVEQSAARLTAELGEIGLQVSLIAAGPRRDATGYQGSRLRYCIDVFDFHPHAEGQRQVCVSGPELAEVEREFVAKWNTRVANRGSLLANAIAQVERLSGKKCVLAEASLIDAMLPIESQCPVPSASVENAGGAA